MLDILLILAALNAALAVPLIVLWRRDYQTKGHISRLGGVWSAVTLYGHGLLTFAVAWVDRGSVAPPTGISVIVGGTLAAAGAGFIFAGRGAFNSRQRVYGRLDDKLVETGAYRWSRNPQYVGYVVMLGGAALAALSAWAFVLTAVIAALVHFHILWVEETHLQRTFGEAYTAYRARVARYFGAPSHQSADHSRA